MTTKVDARNGIRTVPTATEFIPKNQVPGPNRRGAHMIRGYQLVRDGSGMELAFHEPYAATC